MTSSRHAISPDTQQAILAQVLRAIERNRTPGYHFAGNLLALSFDELDEEHASVSMRDGAHCVDADGQVNMAAVSILADIALASAVRGALRRGMRLATVNMQLQFTGARRDGPLTARADFNGYFRHGAAQQGLSSLSLRSAHDEICIGSGAFMVLEPPPGFNLPPMLPLPELAPGAPLLAIAQLGAAEARLYAHAQGALRAAQEHQSSFIERLWHFQTRKNAAGASASLKNGAQVGNRVGHVQGGILLGLAEAAARAALPAHWQLSALTACYLSPGEGTTLSARARIVHKGGRTAVVHGVITGVNRRRVLETVATYAAPPR